MERGLRIGLPVAALILAFAMIVQAQVWTSSAGGVSTPGTMSVGGASNLTGAVTANAGINMVQNGTVLVMQSTGAGADAGLWYFQALNPGFRFGAAEDDFGGQNDVLTVTRSGSTATLFTLGVPLSSVSRANSFSGQPGFLAYNSATDSGLSSGQLLDFDTIVYDITGGFTNDTWTAGVAGVYQFCTGTKFKPASSSGQVVITTSNRAYAVSLFVTTGDAGGGGCVHADMDASDTATVNIVSPGGFDSYGSGSPYVTWFSGRLVP